LVVVVVVASGLASKTEVLPYGVLPEVPVAVDEETTTNLTSMAVLEMAHRQDKKAQLTPVVVVAVDQRVTPTEPTTVGIKEQTVVSVVQV
jgi:hypothetical protein